MAVCRCFVKALRLFKLVCVHEFMNILPPSPNKNMGMWVEVSSSLQFALYNEGILLNSCLIIH